MHGACMRACVCNGAPWDVPQIEAGVDRGSDACYEVGMTVHRGPGNVFEVDVDVGSSRAANTVVGLVAPATKSLIITLGVALEGHSEEV